MKTQMVPLSELVYADYNPRKITPEQRKHIRESLLKFGSVQPLVLNSNPERKNVVIGGEQRALIATELQWKSFPCYYVNLSLEDEKELNIRLNKNTADWDWEKLEEGFSINELLDWGFENYHFGLHNETLPDTVANNDIDSNSRHLPLSGSAKSDVEFNSPERVVFECFMLPNDRTTLTKTLNAIKAEHSLSTTDQALVFLTNFYNQHITNNKDNYAQSI